jgi:hypothetical protein
MMRFLRRFGRNHRARARVRGQIVAAWDRGQIDIAEAGFRLRALNVALGHTDPDTRRDAEAFHRARPGSRAPKIQGRS